MIISSQKRPSNGEIRPVGDGMVITSTGAAAGGAIAGPPGAVVGWLVGFAVCTEINAEPLGALAQHGDLFNI